MLQGQAMQRLSAVSCRALSSKRKDPTVEFDFRPAEEKDKGRIMDSALTGFIKAEPHSVALGLKRDDIYPLLDWIVSKALHYPYSMTIVHRPTRKFAGFRLMSLAHRDHTKDFEPYEIDVSKLHHDVLVLATILDSLKPHMWKVKPQVNKILRREITFVEPEHQRKGIAQHLLHLGLDFAQLKREGVDGVQSEASSVANQTLLAKNGYEMLLEAERGMYKRLDGKPVVFPDETKGLKLFFLDLHKKDK